MDGYIALITGGTGFIGSHLIRHLLFKGWRVHAVVRPSSNVAGELEFAGVTWHRHDGSTKGLTAILFEVNPNVVFHLASLFLSQHHPEDLDGLVASNVLFGAQLLEAMDISGNHNLVNTGTSWQNYENLIYNPVNLYAATKQAFEDIARYYVEARGLRMITLRLSDTYGPNDPRPKLLTLLKRALSTKEKIEMSPGEQLIDLVYIDDVVEAFRLAGERLMEGKGSSIEIYAVTSGKPITLKDLVWKFAKISGQPLQIHWGGRPYRPREVMMPPDIYGPLPNWKAKLSLEEGLIRIVGKASGCET